MTTSEQKRLLLDHMVATRRRFLARGAAASAGLISLWLASERVVAAGDDAALAELPAVAELPSGDRAALERAIAALEYFTKPEAFGTVERGKPLPYTHPPEKLRDVGMVRETWKLEVVGDEEAKTKVDNPLTKEKGNALDFDTLMKLAETKAVRFPKVMTCNNGGSPLGTGLWEGVPLRDVVWLAKPGDNIRRAWYYGYHNDDPAQMFRSSLPIGRVLEDPPGTPPVILAYNLNGEFLSGKRGGPVRLVVPESYGFRSIKWLQKIVLTFAPFANDTYADGANDVESWMKTFARFVFHPDTVKSGRPIPITGFAQVGISGLTKVQYWLHPKGETLPADDPHFTRAPWRDAELLPAPKTWSNLPNDALPAGTFGFDDAGRPKSWPMSYALAHWAALVPGAAPGEYELRCRTIDARGIAQPMPRPFPKSGRNYIQSVPLKVDAG